MRVQNAATYTNLCIDAFCLQLFALLEAVTARRETSSNVKYPKETATIHQILLDFMHSHEYYYLLTYFMWSLLIE